MFLRRVPLPVIAAVFLTLAVTRSAWAGWELADPGTSNPNGVVFCDALHGIVTATSSPGFVFGGADGPPIRWSENAGLDWEGAKIEEAVDYAYSPCLLPGGKGWCLANRKEDKGVVLLATQDYGKTWKPQALPENLKARAITFLPPAGEQAWLQADNNGLWFSSDTGANWVEKPLPANFMGRISSWWVADAQHLFLTGNHGGKLVLARTAEGGATWSKVEMTPQGEGGSLVSISMAPGGQSGWAVGGEGRTIRGSGGWVQMSDPLVLHTSDGGATWQRQKLDIKTRPTCVWAVSDHEAWVGTFGGQGGSPHEPARIVYVWTEG